jgi:hypothetical protein
VLLFPHVKESHTPFWLVLGVAMGRSKRLGKPVEELTAKELQQEFRRCRTGVKLYGNKPAGKGLAKRLHKIERRLAEGQE